MGWRYMQTYELAYYHRFNPEAAILAYYAYGHNFLIIKSQPFGPTTALAPYKELTARLSTGPAIISNCSNT